ncbi:hypothetical protein CCB81_10865 [Armatimonadetes bacterium Uphvl-Ar2]|nr:hypothetical protein CCB81_10865 [Armatimonadetes bacterium Uphvl-Ar2]
MAEDRIESVEKRRRARIRLSIFGESTEVLGTSLERKPAPGDEALQATRTLQESKQDVDAIVLWPVGRVKGMGLLSVPEMTMPGMSLGNVKKTIHKGLIEDIAAEQMFKQFSIIFIEGYCEIS